MQILPDTKIGKWSLILLAGFFLLFLITTVVIVGIFKQEGGETVSDNLFISIPMFSAFGFAIAAFVSGVISVYKYKERSLFIYLPIAIGIIIILFMIGELTTAH